MKFPQQRIRGEGLLLPALDCLSFVVMEQNGIREALPVDSDFTHCFAARPGPKSG